MCLRANELLGDGKWHDYDSIRDEIMLLVPAARAIRDNEYERLRRLKPTADGDTHGRPRVRPISSERAKLSGRRRLASVFLRMNNFERRYITRTVDGKRQKVKQIRMVRVPKQVGIAALQRARHEQQREELE
ncbi:MAG TPA: hypothetical protein VFX53_04460 [Pedococcus sp.]|nr:hypothetical protein [Pedococcus sp.]